MSRRNSLRNGITTAALAVATVALMLFACNGGQDVGSSSSALNYKGDGGSSGNKALNFTGYEYVDSTHITLHLNHTSSGDLDQSMFVVKPHGGSGNLVTGMTYSAGDGYSGCDDTNLTKGLQVNLTTNTLSVDTLYDVNINGTLSDTNGLTLGNYTYRADTVFVFRTPTSCSGTPVVCSWSNTTPLVRYSLEDSNPVPYEQNLVVIFDRPIDPSTLSTFLSNLSDNYKKSGTKVTQDSNNSTNHSAVDGAESYTPHSNNKANVANNNTTFYFPEFVSGSSLPVYNRTNPGSNSYTLTLPGFTDVSSHTFSNLGSHTFSTITSDLPAWLDNTPTTTAGSQSLTVNWNATSITNSGTTTEYDVYYTSGSNKWTGTYNLGCCTATTGTTCTSGCPSCTTGSVPPTSCTISGLTAGHLYYVRVVPKNSVGSVGYSLAGSGTPTR